MAKQYLKSDLSAKQAEVIAQCGLYHDAGKSCIPHSVLNKPGSFTDDEYEIMKKHVFYGCEELESAIDKGAPIDHIVARVAIEHHERMNGEGYPHHRCGRAEEDPENGIHLYSRIIAIADAYSALLMKRVYKPALPAEKAIELMSTKAADHFDMEIFNPFVNSLKTSLRKVEEGPEIDEQVLFDDTTMIKTEDEPQQQGLVYVLDGKNSLVKQIRQQRAHRHSSLKPKVANSKNF